MLLASILSVQIGATLAKRLFPLVGVRTLIALRLGLAALMLCALHRPWHYSLRRTEQLIIVAYGIVLGIMNILFYSALARIPLGIVVALAFAGPISVAALTSRHASDVLWVVLAVCGIGLLLPMSRISDPIDPVGVLYAMGAGICWGLYIVVGQRAGSTVPSGVVTAWGMLIGACLAIPLGLIHARPVSWTVPLLGLAALVAMLSSALPYSLEMLALKQLPTKTFSIFTSVEPAVAAMLGFLLLHEHLTALQWGAIGCVMVAACGSTTAATPQAVQL